MNVNYVETTAACTVAEMARKVGLSRARFYQLMKAGVFPLPLYDVSTRRPFYDEEAQKVCLEVKRRNCGINGKPILFYARRGGEQAPTKKQKVSSRPKPSKQYAPITEAVKALGLASATDQAVSEVVTTLFPGGINGVDESEVIRSVFVHMQRKNCSDR